MTTCPASSARRGGAMRHCGASSGAWRRWLLAPLLAWSLAMLACPSAQALGESALAAHPPARAGQLSFVAGSALMSLGPGAAWEPAELNTPVATGMSWATEKGARLELRIGSTAVRLGQGVQLTLLDLDDGTLRFELAHGPIALRVRTLAAGEQVRVSAGGAVVSVLAPGAYRLAFAPGESRLSVHVLEGQARLSLGGQDHLLQPLQQAVADPRTATLHELVLTNARTPLDDFAQNRDRLTEHSEALRHLPAELSGAESLDHYGSWRDEPGHGAIWYPEGMPADWAPYRDGRWRWIAPWGWTWVDAAPWGFAPFHYGRWLFAAGRWAWVPGGLAGPAPTARPVFAPALVGFYGASGSAAWSPVARGPAVVGWYPLAPGEAYWPAYSNRLDYARALNAMSVGDKNQFRAWPDAHTPGPAHRYARTAFAATAMAQSAFVTMQSVASHQVPLPPAALATAPLTDRRAPPPAQSTHLPSPAAPAMPAPAATTREIPLAPRPQPANVLAPSSGPRPAPPAVQRVARPVVRPPAKPAEPRHPNARRHR